MLILRENQLRRLFEAIAQKFEMSEEESDAWIEHCLLVELRGNLMQGLAYLDHHYIQRFSDGRVVFGAEFTTVKESPAMVVLDAGGAVGALAGKTAMRLAVAKAKKSGACVVSVRNSNDWGMIGYSAMQALQDDCIGIAMVNSRPEVAPWGGTRATFGLNPFSVAIPAGKNLPILLDMSSSDTRGLQAQEDLILGEKIPEGLYYDEDGNVVTDPSKWGSYLKSWGIKGGAQKMSSHRDLGLSVMMDALGGALSGMSCALDLGTPEPAVDGLRTPRGQFVLALDIDQFTPISEFKRKIDRMIDQAKSSPLAPGVDKILLPGERGFLEEHRRRREGIPLHEKVWEDVRRAVEPLGIDADRVVQTSSG